MSTSVTPAISTYQPTPVQSPPAAATSPAEAASTEPPAHGARIRGLDGLRTLALATVVCLHLNWNEWLGGGCAAVTIFFVLSGYLITSGLLKEHVKTSRINIRAFYSRRFWRLGPALIMVVTLGAVASLTLSGRPEFPRIAHPDHYLVTGLLSLTQSLNFAAINGHIVSYELMPTWSLGVEEQFYIFWVMTLFVTLLIGSRRIAAWIAVTGAVLSFGWSWFLVFDDATHDRVAYAPDTQFGGLLVGACLAFALMNPRIRQLISGFWTRQILGWASALIVGMFLLNRPFNLPLYTWGQIVVSCAAAVCVALLVTADPMRRGVGDRALSTSILVWIGERSYGIYLIHVMVMQWLGGPDGLVRGLCVIGISVTLAALSYRYVEKPLMVRAAKRRRLRDQPVTEQPAAGTQSEPQLTQS